MEVKARFYRLESGKLPTKPWGVWTPGKGGAGDLEEEG